MKIFNKEYRIIEKTFGDGHKEYHAQQVVLNLFLFKIWKDYIYDIRDYGYGTLIMKYRFHTYDECLEYLTNNIKEKQKAKQKAKITNTDIIY